MSTYQLNVLNNANSAWNFYVYQQPPENTSDLTLAWFTSPFKIPVGAGTDFSWDINYQFMWSSTGIVRPGITFKAFGKKDCDPDTANTTAFTFQNNTPDFSEPVLGGSKGTLYINDGGQVPVNVFAVGVGMSGAGTFCVNAEPNLIHEFTPTPTYYIAAINEVEQGEVMDIKTITMTAQVQFPPNVFTMTATLQPDNTWTITQGLQGIGQVQQAAKEQAQTDINDYEMGMLVVAIRQLYST